jgi:hypothetical protein
MKTTLLQEAVGQLVAYKDQNGRESIVLLEQAVYPDMPEIKDELIVKGAGVEDIFHRSRVTAHREGKWICVQRR